MWLKLQACSLEDLGIQLPLPGGIGTPEIVAMEQRGHTVPKAMGPITVGRVSQAQVVYVVVAQALATRSRSPERRQPLRQYATVAAWRRSRERRRLNQTACSTPGCRFRRHMNGTLYEDLSDDGGRVEFLCCWRCRLFGGVAHGEMCEVVELPAGELPAVEAGEMAAEVTLVDAPVGEETQVVEFIELDGIQMPVQDLFREDTVDTIQLSQMEVVEDQPDSLPANEETQMA